MLQTMLWEWQRTLCAYSALLGSRRVDRTGGLEAPRVSDAEAVEAAASMVERLQRMYLRTLKALQDQRRTPAVVVRNARQVNLAHPQVNVSQ